jgi:arylsulfatase A-like enzyme
VPEDSLKEYAGKFPEEPYAGDRGYLPNRTPRATYAAMITRLDRDLGKLLALLNELDLERDTIVVFTSDNGPLYDRLGGTDTDFFDSAAGLRGRKGGVYEGGVRVPLIVRWPNHIAANTTSDRVTGFEDWLPTILDLVGHAELTPKDIDGLSFAATLLGKPQEPRPFLYRETPGYGGQQSVQAGDWKAVRTNLNPTAKTRNLPPGEVELYNLKDDPTESKNVTAENPEITKRLARLLAGQHRKSDVFPIQALDPKN